jgi:hypothetical protein
MAKPAADRQPPLAHDPLGAARVLTVAPVRYLQTVRKLLRTYQRVSGEAAANVRHDGADLHAGTVWLSPEELSRDVSWL